MHVLECMNDLEVCTFVSPFLSLFTSYLITERILDYVKTKSLLLVNDLFREISNRMFPACIL